MNLLFRIPHSKEIQIHPAKRILGMFLAASPDFCAGLIIAHAWLRISWPSSLPFWQKGIVYMLGMVFAVLPDVSILALLAIGAKNTSRHRHLTHFPVPILGTCTVLGFLSPWFWFLGACLAAHFMDDATDPGGINLWPFKIQFQILAKEREPLERDDWLKRYFFRPTYKSAMVVTMLIITPIVLLV